MSHEPRFRSLNGHIYSTSPDAFMRRLTITRARQIMNELYDELSKHDKKSADEICKRRNA